MKILFLIESLISGGKQRRLLELIHYFQRNGNNEIMLVITEDDIHYDYVHDLGIKLEIVKRKEGIKKDPRLFFRFFKICKQFNPDIIHSFSIMTTIYAIPAKIMQGLPLISSTVADSERRYSNFSLNIVFFKIACYYSDIIISNSLAGLSAYGIKNNKRSLVVYNGVNISRFQKSYNVEKIKSEIGISSKYIVIMVAAFTDRKDWDLLLNVAKNYYSNRTDVSFLCIGDGEDYDRIMKRKTREDIGNVFLIGKKKNVEKYISISDIGLLCTYAEGISNSIIEYMALNKPVIVTDKFGGSVELVEDGVTGFCVDRRVELVVDKIDLLIKNPQLRKSMGQLGKKKIKESFSIEKMGMEYHNLYQEFAKSS